MGKKSTKKTVQKKRKKNPKEYKVNYICTYIPQLKKGKKGNYTSSEV